MDEQDRVEREIRFAIRDLNIIQNKIDSIRAHIHCIGAWVSIDAITTKLDEIAPITGEAVDMLGHLDVDTELAE